MAAIGTFDFPSFTEIERLVHSGSSSVAMWNINDIALVLWMATSWTTPRGANTVAVRSIISTFYPSYFEIGTWNCLCLVCLSCYIYLYIYHSFIQIRRWAAGYQLLTYTWTWYSQLMRNRVISPDKRKNEMHKWAINHCLYWGLYACVC